MINIILVFIFNLFLSVVCFAQSNLSESLTITTYYPSPYGVYRDLEIHRSIKMNPIDLNSIINPTNGTIAVNQTDNTLWIYKNPVNGWQPVGGGGSSIVPLYNGVHDSAECNALGGNSLVVAAGVRICQLNLASCPLTWTAYPSWTATQPRAGFTICGGCGLPTLVGYSNSFHSWANTPVECDSGNPWCCNSWHPWNACSIVTQIGCY